MHVAARYLPFGEKRRAYVCFYVHVANSVLEDRRAFPTTILLNTRLYSLVYIQLWTFACFAGVPP